MERAQRALLELASRRKYYRLLMRDDLGKSVRLELCPVLSKVEMTLRFFIAKAIVDAFGFRTAQRYVDGAVSQLAPERRNRSGPQTLDCLNLRELLGVVEMKSPAPEIEDFREVLDISASIADAKRRLEFRVSHGTLWDGVFENYFQEQGSWRLIKHRLQRLADIRNKVMHHRQVTYADALRADKEGRRLLKMLEKRKPELSQADAYLQRRRAKSLERKVGKQLSGISKLFEQLAAKVAAEAEKRLGGAETRDATRTQAVP